MPAPVAIPSAPPAPQGAARGPLTTGTLASILKAELLGPPGLPIETVDAIDTAGPTALTLIRDRHFADKWAASRAAAAVVSRGVDVPGHDPQRRALLLVPSADLALVHVLTLLSKPLAPPPPGIHPTAIVDPSARLGPEVSIGPMCIIGPGCVIGEGVVMHAQTLLGPDVRIGARTTLWHRVTIHDRCEIGAHCALHSGVVIGTDGFAYRPGADGRSLVKIPQMGNVRIGDHVEIGANSCIDRARFGATVIGDGTKIDNLVQIAHNVRVGRNCVIAGCTGIAGSVTIGDWVQIGGAVGICDALTIGDGARIGAKSGVMQDVPAGTNAFGYPAQIGSGYLRAHAVLRRLGRADRPR